MARITGLSVFMIRWYLRVTGALLIGYAWFLLLSKHPSLSEVVLTEGLFIALGIVGILGSFRVRREWVLDIVSLLIALLNGRVVEDYAQHVHVSIVSYFHGDFLQYLSILDVR